MRHCLTAGAVSITDHMMWGPTAPPPMSTTIWDDREDAFEAATEAAAWLRHLQATDTWQELPLDVQRHLSRAHGTLTALTSAMVEAEVV